MLARRSPAHEMACLFPCILLSWGSQHQLLLPRSLLTLTGSESQKFAVLRDPTLGERENRDILMLYWM